MFRAPAGLAQILDAFGVNGEKAHGRAVFRGHVGYGRAVHHRQRRRARPVKLNEFAHHLGLAEYLRHGQGQVGRRHPLFQRPRQIYAHHVRRQEINRLPQHARLGFDAAHPPADDAQAVDHCRVRIGPHQRVGVAQRRLRAQYALGQVFQIDLMHDADAGRDYFESVEGLHAPFEELVTLAVALEFHVHVPRQRVARAGEIHLHGMVHHQVHRHQRLDDFGIPAQLDRRRAHGGQVHQQGNAREILQDNAGHDERDFLRARCVGLPLGQLAHAAFRDFFPVAIAQDRFQNQADGDGQLGNRPHPGLLQGGQGIKLAL